MATKVDQIGTYLAEVADSSISTTKKGFPQWVARLKITHKYIDNPAEMAHWKLEEPAYVDYSSFDEEIVGFFVLFNNADVFDESSALLNYKQLQLATGWDGSEFDSLGNGSLNSKSVMIRTEENTYQDKTSIQVTWIDAADATPGRTLKSLDAADLKVLSSKLKIAKKPVAAATATKAPTAAPTPAKPAASKAVAAAPAVTPKAAPAPKATPAAPTPKAKAAPKAPAAKPVVAEEAPTETTKDDAWAAVMAGKGANSDDVVVDAWQSAMGEVLGDERAVADDATPAEWATIRDTVLKDLR